MIAPPLAMMESPDAMTGELRVLVGTDHSAGADGAIAWARDLVHRTGGELRLVHAIESVGRTASLGERNEAGRDLSAAEHRLRDGGVHATARYRSGRPCDVIIDLAAEWQPDLIVIGAHGHSAARRLVLGSTTDRVVRQSSVPVVTVPDAGRRPSKIREVLIGTDFSAQSAAAIEAFCRLVPAVDDPPVRLVLFHAWVPATMIATGAVEETLAVPHDDEAALIAADLDRLAESLRERGYEVECVSTPGYAASLLRDEAERRASDLIVLGTHGRHGFEHLLLGSVAERVLHHAPCPVLTMRCG